MLNAAPNWNDDDWLRAPIIVSNNEVKDMINEAAAQTFACKTGQLLHWYFCQDFANRKPVDSTIRSSIKKLHSGKTGYRLGRLPLVITMPVMITQNINVQSGIVNGCIGMLVHIHYMTDNEGQQHAVSCVVHTPSSSGDNLVHLPPFHSVVLEDTVDVALTQPHSKQVFKFKRCQIPLMPAFTMTTHKSQGLMLP